jgi:chaperonin GroEL (HSP60 family)
LDQYEGEFQIGVKVMAEALRKPRKRLYQTVDAEERPLESNGWIGYNIKSEKHEDMFECGIVDSVEVCKNVIIDSISLASQLIEV